MKTRYFTHFGVFKRSKLGMIHPCVYTSPQIFAENSRKIFLHIRPVVYTLHFFEKTNKAGFGVEVLKYSKIYGLVTDHSLLMFQNDLKTTLMSKSIL